MGKLPVLSNRICITFSTLAPHPHHGEHLPPDTTDSDRSQNPISSSSSIIFKIHSPSSSLTEVPQSETASVTGFSLTAMPHHNESPSPAPSPSTRHNCVLSSAFPGLTFLNRNAIMHIPLLSPCSDVKYSKD